MVQHDGKLLAKFQRIKIDLNVILGEVQLAMRVKHIEVDQHVLEDVMSHEYRDIKREVSRNVRDLLILRECIQMFNFVQQLFDYLRRKRGFNRTQTNSEASL